MTSSVASSSTGALTRARGLLRVARHLPERLLHARRRSAAERALRRWTIRSVLFLCHGNICRSPFAAAAFAKALPPRLRRRISVRSLGFISPGRPAPPQALAAATRLGVDLSAHRSALVSGEAVRKSDLVVVMSTEQAAAVRAMASDTLVLVLGDLDPHPIDTRTIRDPWGCEDAVFHESYARIERCIAALARLVAASDAG